ncbi:hypothetical protein LCGC14_0224530 [marine sediment metagenome]|uniref:Uncharacterized protein n=1 Tax=marine sediment metagenome TaxID=412755 RepID=A0A0F9UGU0_9ZZZZ|nr:hypothetical protein [bacterium]
MTKVPKKIPIGTSLLEEDRIKLEALKERSYIKSIAEGIRRATNEWLHKPEVVIKLNEDVNQKRIVDYARKQKKDQ